MVIGDVPSYRVDNMPYGGVKDSGLGREGVRFAMEDMTEIRNLVIRRRDVGPPLQADGGVNTLSRLSRGASSAQPSGRVRESGGKTDLTPALSRNERE